MTAIAGVSGSRNCRQVAFIYTTKSLLLCFLSRANLLFTYLKNLRLYLLCRVSIRHPKTNYFVALSSTAVADEAFPLKVTFYQLEAIN